MDTDIKRGTRKGSPNYSIDFKRRLAMAACESGMSVSKLALSHQVNANMVFKWRRRHRACPWRRRGQGAAHRSAKPAAMMGLPAGTRIWIAAGFTEMRSGFNGLAAKVEGALADDPFSGNVFVFRGRRRDRIKLLIYDRTGFWLLMKRLEQDRFEWPRRSQAVLELTSEQLHWLLEGIDLEAVRRHPVRQYQHIG